MAAFLHHLDLPKGTEMVTLIIANCVAVCKWLKVMVKM